VIGGMGEVYRVTTRLDRTVAIKVLNVEIFASKRKAQFFCKLPSS
jgi:hypothetical protein